MNRYFLCLFCWLMFSSACDANPGQKFPRLSVSDNRRYLVAGDEPFFWLGDTGWLMLAKLNREETVKYLDDRKMKGFNVIQVMLLHTLAVTSSGGDSALVGKNPATPKLIPVGARGQDDKGGYWEHLDYVAELAAQRGICLALVPIWGPNVRAGLVTERQAESFARFLAQRYRNQPNIIWVNGGDVRGDDAPNIWNIIGKTLKKEDPGHLVTFHPFGRTQSSTWFHKEEWLDFNMFQSGHRNYSQDTSRIDLQYGEDNWRYLRDDYGRIPVKPTLDGEPSYEGIPHGLHDTLQPRWTDADLRRYAYWSVFSGGCGFTYGNNSVMQFQKKDAKTGSYGAREPWEEAILAPGAGQMIHLKTLMLKYHFESLVPDQSLLADPGEKYNHLSALMGKHCLLVYSWNGRTFGLRTELLAAEKYRVTWFSPKEGKFSKGGNFTRDHLKMIDPPGESSEGSDLVMILEGVSGHFSTVVSPKPIPRDTSFTPDLAWMKIVKEFPQAKIVLPVLQEGTTADYGVVYSTLYDTPYGKRELHLDIFRPAKEGKYPALLMIHGGGWRSGDRSMENPMAMRIAAHGYVTATVEYRLSPEALYPAAVQDIKAALRFLRANAKMFRIDPDRMALSGTSAGGQLAALAGMTPGMKKFEGPGSYPGIPTNVQAIIDMDGILDFTDPNESGNLDPAKPSAGTLWFGGTILQVREKWEEASPLVYAGEKTPPMLFVNSALPRFHAGRESVMAILNKHSVYSEVHTIPATPHPFWLFEPWFSPAVSHMVAFLDRVLKKNDINS